MGTLRGERCQACGIPYAGLRIRLMTGTVPIQRSCTERGRLLDLLSRASLDYAKAAVTLAQQVSSLPKAEYSRKSSEVENARRYAHHARQALLAHRKEHGC